MRTLAVTLALLVSTTAHADELDRARELEASLEYEQALAIVDVALARGGAEPVRFVELELYAGRLAAGLDRTQAAEAHFARALAVRPDVRLPEGTSPKITTPFEAARARTTPLRVVARAVADGIEVELADASGLVWNVAVGVVEHGVRREIVGAAGPHVRLAVPAGATPVDVTALDERANRVWTGPAPVRVVPAHRGRLARPSMWLGVAAVAAVAGGVAAWRFDVAQHDFDGARAEGGHDFTELEAIERRGRRWGYAADLGVGAAVAAALTAGVLWLRNPRPGDRIAWLVSGRGVWASVKF